MKLFEMLGKLGTFGVVMALVIIILICNINNISGKDFSGEIIGSWVDECPYSGHKIILFRRDGKIRMTKKFIDGSVWEEEMVQSEQSGKLRFEEKESNRSGEYYLIENNGFLGIYDKYGFIYKCPEM
jgi:hypothetical protein